MPNEIIKQVKAPKGITNRLDKTVRSKIILDLVNGKTWDNIEKEYSISSQTLSRIQEDNRELITGLKEKRANQELERREKLYWKTLDKLEKRIDDETKPVDDNFILATNKEMAIQIKANQTGDTNDKRLVDPNEAKTQALRIAKLIEQGDTKTLIEVVFKQ